MAEDAIALHGTCGHAVSMVLANRGERVCTLLFFDDEPSSDTYTEQVHKCPGCGELLGLHTLVGRIDLQRWDRGIFEPPL